MLRFIVLLLILANGAYFAWAQGYLASIGLARAPQSEPQRLQAQIKPDAIRLLSPTEAKRVEALAAAPPPKPPECLQSALLDERQLGAVRSAAASLPAGSFSLQEATEPARWIVYMGKYANADAMAKKKAELRVINVTYEPLRNPALEIGFAIGGWPTQSQANDALANLATRGVRTAKVVQEFPERKGQIIKLSAVDDTLRPQLEGIKTAVGAGGLVACKA
jgi:hypothetical protein